jgi:outer membrane immunogenic protein
MKRLFLACIVFCAFAAPAIAADVSVLGPYQPPPLRPLYSWTGCYIGVNFGGGYAPNTFVDTAGTFGLVGASLGVHNARGVAGGGQIGCDYQTGPFVFGVQGLYDLTGMKAYNFQPNSPSGLYGGLFLVNNTFIQSIPTLTGRVGYAVQPTMLLYAKAGAAWVHDLYNVSTFQGSQGPTIIALGGNTSRGWTVGAGFEWAFFGGDWSAFLEYDYMDFGTSRVTLNTANRLTLVQPLAFQLDVGQRAHLVLFGINYRFYGALPRF